MEINARPYTAILKAHAEAINTQRSQENSAQILTESESAGMEGSAEAEDVSPGALLQRFSESLDEMSAFLSMFRNRRDVERKNGATGESVLERVLEEDLQPKMRALIKAVQGSYQVDIELLLQQLRSLFPDDSDLVLVLREMLYNRELDEVVKKRLQKLLEYVEKQADPRRLKAGINIALKARLFGRHLNFSPALLRNSYRDFLTDNYHEIDVYQTWIEQYGPEVRHQVVDFMEGALLTDMEASDPSCSNLEFGNLLGKLGIIKVIRSSDKLFIHTLMHKQLVRELAITENDWLYFMFCMLKNGSLLGQYLRDILGSKLKSLSAFQFSALLSTLYFACKRLPRHIFYDEKDWDELEERFKALTAQARKLEQREKN